MKMLKTKVILVFATGLFIAGCGGSLAKPPAYFLDHVGAVSYVDKLLPGRLAQTNWDGSIEIKANVTPLFTNREIILLHEQAHSFEIIAARDRPDEYTRFRKKFDLTYKSEYVEIEEFPKAVIRALQGKKDKGATIAMEFISGQYQNEK